MKIMFRSLGFVAVLAMATLLPSCDKVKDLISINIPLKTANVKFTITPKSVGSAELGILQYGVNIDSLLKKENSDFSTKNIKKARVKSLNLTLTNATDVNSFGNFSAFEAGLSSNSKPGYTVIAGTTATNPEAYATTVSIPVKDVELKEYFGSTVLYYKLSGTARKATTIDLQGVATIEFDLEVGL